MNKTKKIIILFVVVLFLICIKNVQQGRILKEQICILDSLSENNAFIKDALLLQISLYANRDIISNLENMLCDSIDIVSPVLLYRCSGMMCQSCIDTDMASLLNFIQRIKKRNLLILPSKENSKDSNVKIKSIWGDYWCISVDNEIFALPIDEEGMPCRYFAIMDTNKHIKEIFFPNSNSIATTYYLEYICNKYFE